jgi:hypothetical protein
MIRSCSEYIDDAVAAAKKERLKSESVQDAIIRQTELLEKILVKLDEIKRDMPRSYPECGPM